MQIDSSHVHAGNKDLKRFLVPLLHPPLVLHLIALRSHISVLTDDAKNLPRILMSYAMTKASASRINICESSCKMLHVRGGQLRKANALEWGSEPMRCLEFEFFMVRALRKPNFRDENAALVANFERSQGRLRLETSPIIYAKQNLCDSSLSGQAHFPARHPINLCAHLQISVSVALTSPSEEKCICRVA
jgi:hypothetical protein